MGTVFTFLWMDDLDSDPVIETFETLALAEVAEFRMLANLYQGDVFVDETCTEEIDVAGTNTLEDLRTMFVEEFEHFGSTLNNTQYWIVETEVQSN